MLAPDRVVTAAAAATGCATLLARHAVKEMVMASPINVLLVCVPVGIAAQLAGAGAVPVFVLVGSFLSVRSFFVAWGCAAATWRRHRYPEQP